jgi:hypothetical protein
MWLQPPKKLVMPAQAGIHDFFAAPGFIRDFNRIE